VKEQEVGAAFPHLTKIDFEVVEKCKSGRIIL
jgi:hypothetical protein